MAFWLDIASFALKSFWILVMIGGLIGLAALFSRGGAQDDDDENLKIVNINDRYDQMEEGLARAALDSKDFKARAKGRKAQEKAERKTGAAPDARIFVLDFASESKSAALELFGRKISGVLTIARPERDEILLRLESPGGAVTAYGLAAAQLMRVREAGVMLTIAVDEVAASGGYMMAVVANKILAAPFAVVGSIGVIAPAPNLHRLLKKHDIDYEELTAGEFKRPMSLLGENTEAGKLHTQQKLQTTHEAFKDFVHAQRPQLDMSVVANGDYWYGRDALKLGLVDALTTSDAYLFSRRAEATILLVNMEPHQSRLTQLLNSFGLNRLGLSWRAILSRALA